MVDPVVTPLVIGAATWLGGALTSQAGESVALSLATNLGTSQLLDPVCRRIRGAMGARMAGTDGSLPRNHDVERAVRTAQMQANRALVAEFGARAAGRNAPSDVAFAKKAGTWIEDQYGAVGRLQVSDAVHDATVAAIDASLIDRAQVAGNETLRDQAAAATQAALAEMEAAVGPVSQAFRARFLSTDPDEKPWFDAFGAFLAEQVKKNADFRAILTAANLAEISAGVRRTEEMADEWAVVADDLRAKADEALARLERIETKVDKVQTTVDRLEEMMGQLAAQHGASPADVEALRAERDHLKAQDEIKDRAYEGFLRDLGEQPIPPEQWAAQLASFAERYQTLLSESRARTNLPADLEGERLRAEAAIEAGDLDAAETILAELSDRMAAHRVQAGREEAAIRARRAEIARTRLRYRDAAALFAQAAELEPADDQEAVWRRLVEQTGALYDQCNEFGDNGAGRDAIDVCRNALAAAPRERVPLDWATTQNNLGNCLATLGERESGTTRLEEAVEAYRAALTEYTREREPLKWAATQNNLGTALWTLGERESGTARLEEAVQAYRAALTEYTRERVPLEWAMTQNNLGNPLATLGERESGTARLEEAVEAFRSALTERTRERGPLDWAMTQNNLGNALQTLGERESGTARLEEAVQAYRAALTEHTRERVPLDWAMTQNNLGSALGTLGERESGTARLEEAVEAYRTALTEYTRERVPLDWAMTQNNLGNALRTLGQRESGTARLEEAVEAFRSALTERKREHGPLDWAMTQNNLGNALATLGERESGTARLEEAVQAYRAALRERTRERVPLKWAMTQNNLALARDYLFDRTGDVAHLEAALTDARAALEVYEAAGAGYYVQTYRPLFARLEAKRAALP